MGHPSSSHRDADTTTHRAHRTSSSQHHHHRTISSTTLLLVLSLILAVLAVMLSLPSRHSHHTATSSASSSLPIAADGPDHAGTSAGFWGYLTPKRSHALVSRESNVALREAEVARREAELLVQAPGGIAISCPPCQAVLEEHHYEPSPPVVVAAHPPPPPPPATTTIEVVKTVEVTPSPEWVNARVQEILDREMKIAEREKDVGKREDFLGKRESDATRREGWISEQIAHLHQPPVEHVETEEYVYEAEPPRHYYADARRPPPKPGATVIHHHRPQVPVPPPVQSTSTFQAPAHTHGPADPTPETFIKTSTGVGARPTKEVFVEVEEPVAPKTVVVESRTKVGGRKVPPPQGIKVNRREDTKETVFETIYQARSAPPPPPVPKGHEGKHPKTHRRWFGAEW